ncbi:hypothetical protein DPMN_055309 [Dreissena polymorpha]|uniref:Uncharacterized protein n=1 Tax=Dreissena polymorpha TaxID=45954 RepID=A0A9D4HSE4_DREPO|nr:hypothetical protein DPMN_055309 [Dreissena polymorpha]
MNAEFNRMRPEDSSDILYINGDVTTLLSVRPAHNAPASLLIGSSRAIILYEAKQLEEIV